MPRASVGAGVTDRDAVTPAVFVSRPSRRLEGEPPAPYAHL